MDDGGSQRRRLGAGRGLAGAISPLIALATEALIALSTRGDSFRLRRAMRAHAG